jgi:hypothetical protein
LGEEHAADKEALKEDLEKKHQDRLNANTQKLNDQCAGEKADFKEGFLKKCRNDLADLTTRMDEKREEDKRELKTSLTGKCDSEKEALKGDLTE